MLSDLVRDAPLGQVIRFVTKNRYFQYPEEKPDFKLPDAWAGLLNNPDLPLPDSSSATARGSDVDSVSASGHDVDDDDEHKLRPDSPSNGQDSGGSATVKDDEKNDLRNASSNGEQKEQGASSPAHHNETFSGLHDVESNTGNNNLEHAKSVPIVPRRTKDNSILVDWYYTDDDMNPHNWSDRRRLLISTIICLYTFVVYTTSAIYTTSQGGVQKAFNISGIESSLGLSLYVLGYGIGPLFFSPLSEIPIIGRNPVYMVTMVLFVILSIPTAFVGNFAGLLVLRFLTGFFGSPCLASGGASLADIYSLMSMPYAMMAWVAAAYCGPALGPLLSGFAVPAESWRWSLYESIWASAPIAILMLCLLPETSTPNILLRRAQRLRKLTGNPRFMAQSEIDQRNMKFSAVAIDAFIKPMEITLKDPAVLFVQVYTAIIYGIYYSFFEVFPLVYPVYYGMNMGEVGLVFLCVLVACILGVATYMSWLYFYQNPRIVRSGMPPQENRLLPALVCSFGPTIGLFIFAWTARRSVHWIVPTVGIVVYGATVFVVMQCIFVYIPLSYPMYAASLFAANDFFRSALACGSVIFAHPLFGNLGVAKGTSLLGGLSVIGIVGIWLLYFYGARLRSMSKFAISTTPTF